MTSGDPQVLTFIAYDSSNSEAALHARTGSTVAIVREFPVDEGRRMYVVRFEDGYEAEVFPDELVVEPRA